MREKFASPTNSCVSPNASCRNSEAASDCRLGHTKKTKVIASWGASSASGRRTPGKMTRFSCMPSSVVRPALHVGLFELAQQIVAAENRAVERVLGAVLALQRALDLLLDDVADLDEPAEPQALRILGRGIERHLPDRDVGARVLRVEPLVARALVGGLRDRQVAGLLMPPGLHLGQREIG